MCQLQHMVLKYRTKNRKEDVKTNSVIKRKMEKTDKHCIRHLCERMNHHED